MRYLIGVPLIGALMLSVLNAIMGCGRSLFQASEDRLIPKFFSHKNKHHSPDHAMFFNLGCALVVGLFGSPVRIYIFSNVGYLIAIVVCALRILRGTPVPTRKGQPVPPARLCPIDSPGHGPLPHLRLLRRRLGIAGHRGRPGSGTHALSPWLRRGGHLRAPAPVAEDDRQERWRGALEPPAHRGGLSRRCGLRRYERSPTSWIPAHMDAIDMEAAGIGTLPSSTPEAG